MVHGGIVLIADVIVVGAGASGLLAAVVAARQGRSVTILEHKDRIGKKILATGNGKCNYTNLNQDFSFYRGDYPGFVEVPLNIFGAEDAIAFFQELGIYPREKNGYLYPNSEQASSVLDVLRIELQHLGVNIMCNEHVLQIDRKQNSFFVKTKATVYQGKKVILATGGMASADLGSDGSGYAIAKKLGHSIIEPVPALVQLKAKEPFFKALAGIRTQVKLSLYIDEECREEASGELQLTAYGVSGIPVFEVSRYASKALQKKEKVHMIIDFLPGSSNREVLAQFNSRIKAGGYKTAEELMIGLLNKKLNQVLLKEAGISATKKALELSEKEVKELVKRIKEFRVTIYEANSFANAQVSAGGVNTKEIDNQTMESQLIKGLYIVGELLDIDGSCGGYNLQWAWTSGYLAGMDAAKEVQ